tara:strand:+ start:6633 stop:7595 length:963 start_codon:yes stop_codon:yes gene_type:complete
MINFKSILGISSILFFASCEKQEIPITPHQPGDVIVNSVNLDSDYKFQVFFSLKENKVVSQNYKTDWDIAFDCSSSSNNIILNTAKFMKAAKTNASDFSSVTDTAGLDFKIDMPSGNLDSTAIGNWNVNDIYVIDRGYDEQGVHLGFVKFSVTNYLSNKYTIRFADINGTNDISLNITKDTLYNFKYLSFLGNEVTIEPPKQNWDLLFTQYTHYFNNDGTNYLVTGCLINRYLVQVAQVFNEDFNDISFDDIDNYTFSNNINTIGYNWKEYNFDENQYIIFSNKNYIIKSVDGKYYKFHFIDFYDKYGNKGNPIFEFQEL